MKSIIIFGGSGYVGKNLIRSFAKKDYKIISESPFPPDWSGGVDLVRLLDVAVMACVSVREHVA